MCEINYADEMKRRRELCKINMNILTKISRKCIFNIC